MDPLLRWFVLVVVLVVVTALVFYAVAGLASWVAPVVGVAVMKLVATLLPKAE